MSIPEPAKGHRVAAVAPTGRAVAVRLDDVTAGYGSRVALSHVSLTVPAGSLLAVIGPNGAGKTTLIKVMAGLLEPWTGRVETLGGPSGANAKRIAYLPQAELVDWH